MSGHLPGQYGVIYLYTEVKPAQLRMQRRGEDGRESEVFIQQTGLYYKQRGDLIRLRQITFKHI